MAWSVVLGGLGLLQQMSASNRAQSSFNQAQEFNRYAFDTMMDWRQDEKDYTREIDALNRAIASDERTFAESELEEYKANLLKERQFEIDRMLALDKEAARQFAFKMEQYLQNQELSQQERQFALEQLEEAKRIAKGERDEDQRRFEMAKAQKEIERQFQLAEYNNARIQAMHERNAVMSQRERIMDDIKGLQTGLQDTYASLQDVPDVQPITQEEIDSEIARRTDQYISDVDRAADKVASVSEADLIRGGMDNSTQANSVRSDVASRLADEYQKARFKAYDDAMTYIGGQQNLRNTDLNTILASRDKQLGQYGNVFGAGITEMTNLPNAPTALGYMNYQPMSAIYDRSIGSSANNFQDKYGLRSAVTDGYVNLGQGMSGLTGQNIGRMGTNMGMTMPSAVYGYNTQNWGDPNSVAGNMLTSATKYLENTLKRGDTVSKNFSKTFGDWMIGANEW